MIIRAVVGLMVVILPVTGSASGGKSEEEPSIQPVRAEASERPLIETTLNAHLNFLDSIASMTFTGSLWKEAREGYSIEFLERITGIPCLYGRKKLRLTAVGEYDLLQWRRWLELNMWRLRMDWTTGQIIVDSTDMSAGLSDQENIDSVLDGHLQYLDSMTTGSFRGEGYWHERFLSTLLYMEDLTGIESTGDYSSQIGALNVKPIDLVAWRKWLKGNRNRLRWDVATKRVVLDSSDVSPD